MGGRARGWIGRWDRRHTARGRLRQSGLRAPGKPRCFRCGYPLSDLPSWECPECGSVSDPAWYTRPLAAGSRRRRRLVGGAIVNVWLHTTLLVLVIAANLSLCHIAGPRFECPAGWIIGLGVASVVTASVGVWAVRRRRQLVWGPKRAAVLLLVFVGTCAGAGIVLGLLLAVSANPG